jgi:hypothetical protein
VGAHGPAPTARLEGGGAAGGGGRGLAGVPRPARGGRAAKYDLFVAEVVAAWVDDVAWDTREHAWRFPDEAHHTVHHLAGGVFFTTGERVQATKPGREGAGA